ncbi:hypothetical protein [Actinophytocola sp.]|uniref:hypothetical protein n=1 Tax=Actinophytocola sp. TaxID=1872138 RepID=UPI003D6B2FC0
MSAPQTDRAVRHLAKVAAQAATLRAKARELAKLRAELDRMIVDAYRDHVPASHLAEAAQFSRDTVHAAVRPWLGQKRPRPTTQKTTTPTKTATKKTTKTRNRRKRTPR